VLIDCHVHLNQYDDAEPLPVDQRVRHLLQVMEENAVDHAVVLTSYTVTPHRPHIDEVIAAVAGDPRLSIVEGLRWRGAGERTDLFNMEERIRRDQVKGIKLYPGYDGYAINDPSLESFFLLADKYDVPIMIHTGDTYSKRAKVRQAHPLLVDDVAVDYPEVKIIMCHLGNPWFDDAAEVLYKNDNVFADISGLVLGDFTAEFERRTLERMREMIHYAGNVGRQLLFGTDWPLVGMKSYIRFFRELELTEEERVGVAWKNAAKLFKIDMDAASQPTQRS